MTLLKSVTDDQLGQYYRRTSAIADRLGKSLEFEQVMDALQRIHDGQFNFGAPSGIPIDRSKPFNPAKFIGKGWTIEKEDERSLKLTELDLVKVQFVTMLKGNESSITCEEKLTRLKNSDYIRLDAKIFQTLWENKSLIPESWKDKVNGNTRYIFFDGTELRGPDGDRCVLYLYWYDGEWLWYYRWLDDDWSANTPSAVLASN